MNLFHANHQDFSYNDLAQIVYSCLACFLVFRLDQRQPHNGMQVVQSGSQRYRKQDRWQLPGLTVSDAFKPEDWQNFCTKVDAVQQPGAAPLRDHASLQTAQEWLAPQACSLKQISSIALMPAVLRQTDGFTHELLCNC